MRIIGVSSRESSDTVAVLRTERTLGGGVTSGIGAGATISTVLARGGGIVICGVTRCFLALFNFRGTVFDLAVLGLLVFDFDLDDFYTRQQDFSCG